MNSNDPNNHLVGIKGGKQADDEVVSSKGRELFDRMLPPLAVLTTASLIGGFALRGGFKDGISGRDASNHNSAAVTKAENEFKHWPGSFIDMPVKPGKGAMEIGEQVDPGLYSGDTSSVVRSQGLTDYIQSQAQGPDGILQIGQTVSVPIVEQDSPFQPMPQPTSKAK